MSNEKKGVDSSELILILAKLALTHGPTIASSIKRLISRSGQPALEEFERAKKILAKNPEDYFGERHEEEEQPTVPPLPPVQDDHFYWPMAHDERPPSSQFAAGDELWKTGDGKWFVLSKETAAFGFVKPDGSEKVETY